MFIEKFHLLDEGEEANLVKSIRDTAHASFYPIQLFTPKQLSNIEFKNITIFYGNNGSGKSTLLNILARFYNASQQNKSNKGSIFDRYVEALEMYNDKNVNTTEIKLISSDDVFDKLLDIRAINSGVSRKKQDLIEEYFNYKNKDATSWDNLEDLKKINDSRSKTMSSYIRMNLYNDNIIEKSNGETSLLFWQQQIMENGVYFLDEPENSLSAINQVKLKQFIEESSRFYNCQFIIATHSPFLLKLDNALIYDLDTFPCKTKQFNELQSVQVYYNFFKDLKNEFE